MWLEIPVDSIKKKEENKKRRQTSAQQSAYATNGTFSNLLSPTLLGAPAYVLIVSNLSASSSGVKHVLDISTNHLWDSSDSSSWLMLQQCSFGTERLHCRLPSNSLKNSLHKHVLPNSLRHALISLTGRETRSRKNTFLIVYWHVVNRQHADCETQGERWKPPLLKRRRLTQVCQSLWSNYMVAHRC